jgi:hypothetical protein
MPWQQNEDKEKLSEAAATRLVLSLELSALSVMMGPSLSAATENMAAFFVYGVCGK